MALAIAKAAPLRPEVRLSQALKEYESILSPEQKDSYDKSPPDVSAVMALTCEVDRQTAGRKTRRWGARLTSFLNSIHGFTTIADVIVSNMGDPIAGAIWGAVKVAIQTASCYQAYFDSLSTMLMNIGLNSPRIEKYALLYPSSASLQKELCNYYSVVVNLCTRIVVFVRKPISRQIANALRKSFEDEFGCFQRDLGRLGTVVKDEASIAAKQQQNLDSKAGAQERKESALYRATGARFRRETASELAQLRRTREGTLKSYFLNTCSKYNPEISLNQARRKGASKWILQSKDYQQWREAHSSSTLLCSGIVGSGKTVLCASVIEDLTVNKPVDSSLAYFFCRYDEAVSLNAREVMGSIAKQFFQTLPLEALPWEALRRKDVDPNAEVAMFHIQQITDAMSLLLPKARKYIIVLDGLDECEQEEVNTLIQCLKSLVTVSGRTFKILWSGRTNFVPRFSQQLRPDIHVQMSSLNNGTEISNFIEDALAEALESGKLKLRCPEIIIQIQEALEADAQEMFLWVVFQIESICAQNSDHDILRSLKDLPRGLPATFRRILRRLHDSAVANHRLARKILEIVAGARRPLNLDELGEAMSLVPGNTSWDSSKLINDVSKLLECCGSLLVVDEEFSTIHFAHSSVKEHLISLPTVLDVVEYHIDLVRADSDLGRLCVTYLSLDVFSSQLTKSNGQPQSYAVNVPTTVVQSTLSKHDSIKRVALAMLKGRRTLKNDSVLDFQRNPDLIHTKDTQMKNNFYLLSYCREHWLHHTKRIHLLVDDNAYTLWERVVSDSTTTVELPWAPEQISSCGKLLTSWLRANLHLALTRKTIEQLWEIVTTEVFFVVTPIEERRWRYDQFEALLGLLSDHCEWRSLSLTSSSWMNEMLEDAVKNGCELFVELLLQQDVNVNSHTRTSSALITAIEENNKNIIALLFDHGADINHSHDPRGTALHVATSRNDSSIIELLIEKGADVNARGGKYGTALIAAVWKGNLRALELLLDAGADINEIDYKYGTALMTSVRNESHRIDILDLLLRKGADVNTQGGEYSTALITAVAYDHVLWVHHMLKAGANVNGRSEYYGTALDVSLASHYNPEIFDSLIDGGAEVNYKSPGRDSPLLSAVKHGHSYAVTRLLDVGADVSKAGETLSSLLRIAAVRKEGSVVKALLVDDLDAATDELKNFERSTSTRTMKKIMDFLETDEATARVICKARAGGLLELPEETTVLFRRRREEGETRRNGNQRWVAGRPGRYGV